MAASNFHNPTAWIATFVVLLTACSPLPSDVLPDSVAVRVANPIAWPAGKLIVVSSAFRARTDLPDIRLDTLPLSTARVNDSTVSADLPDTSGDFLLHLRYRGAERTGNVRLVGLTDRTETVALTGWPIPTSPGSHVLIAAAESNLVRLDLSAGSAVDLPVAHSAACAISPGPSFRDSVIVAQSLVASATCGKPKGWQFAPTVLAVDSVPYTNAADRMWAHLAPDTWLETAHHTLTIFNAGQVTLNEQLEEGERAILSPDRSRAVVLTTYALYQVPVLLTEPGTIAYRLPLLSAEAAAFSPDGDTLFSAGYNAFSPGALARLLAVEAATGVVLVHNDSLDQELWDIVLDPDAPWLYGVKLGFLDSGATQPVIEAFDRHTLRFLGGMRPPVNARCTFYPCGQVGLAIDRATRTLYAVDVEGWGSSFSGTPAVVFSFELVPASQVQEILSPTTP
jgi:hypothetical protein